VGVAITLLSVGLAAATANGIVTDFTKYQAMVRYTDMGADRMLATFNAITAVEDLMEAAKGWRPFTDEDDEAAARAAVRGNMSDFAALHR
jgi:hypothetical protein